MLRRGIGGGKGGREERERKTEVARGEGRGAR